MKPDPIAMTRGAETTAHATISNSHVTLGEGSTHFAIEGPADGIPLVLLHGATVPLWQFDCIVPLLTAAGFRILRFDLYGHGLSACPRTRYTLDLFVRQTLELIDATAFPGPSVLLGHSLGAAVASAVAVARPDCVERIVLNAPLLDFEIEMRWSAALGCPGLGELMMRFIGIPRLIRRRESRYAAIGQPGLGARFREQTRYAGLGRTVLSMLRNGTLGDHGPRYRKLGEQGHDVTLIWGNRDAVIPAADIATIRDLLSAHEYVEIDGGQHNLLMTHPAVVAAVLAKGPCTGELR